MFYCCRPTYKLQQLRDKMDAILIFLIIIKHNIQHLDL